MPVSITLRSVKGTALTNAEMDANLNNLKAAIDQAQADILALPTTQTVTNAINLTGSGTISSTTTATTQPAFTNDTSIATTAFVQAVTSAAIVPLAPLASPALVGTPTAPTASTNTNTTQIATTAFVKASEAALIPAPVGGTFFEFAFIPSADGYTPDDPVTDGAPFSTNGIRGNTFTFSTSYAEIANFYITLSGEYRVSYNATQPSGSTCTHRLYKNGSPLGTEFVFGNADGSPDGVPTRVETFTFAAGDTVQIFGKISNPVDWAQVTNVKFGISKPPIGTLVHRLTVGQRP